MLVPAYLQDLSERRFALGEHPTTSAHLVRLIVQDLARYVKARYGDEEDVLSSERAIAVDDEQNRAEALAESQQPWSNLADPRVLQAHRELSRNSTDPVLKGLFRGMSWLSPANPTPPQLDHCLKAGLPLHRPRGQADGLIQNMLPQSGL